MNSIVHRIYRIYIISEEFFSARNESLPRINYSSKLPLGILIYLKEEDTFHYLPPRFLVHLISQVPPRLFPSTTKCVYIYIYISLILPARRWLLKFISARWSLHRGRLILQVFHIHFL